MLFNLDPMTLMYIQAAMGFMGALTFMYFARIVGRWLGLVQSLRPYFTPGGGARNAVVGVIAKARREILAHVYGISDEGLLAALVEAKKRGVTVTVILDGHHEKVRTDDCKFMVDQGLDPLLDHEPRANWNALIVDGKVLILGSYDFSAQAEKDFAQQLLVIRANPDLINLYRAEFQKHKEHAKPVQAKAEEKLRVAA